MNPSENANKEILRKWVEKLRNPDAVQRTNILGDPSGARCCLGVACDLAVEAGIIPPPTVAHSSLHGDTLEYNGENSYLPHEVWKWMGMNSDTVILTDKDGINYSAVYLNDAAKYTFSEIADAIERTYLSDENEETEE